MKYGMTRKLNLGKRFGMQYETVDFTVEDCDSKKEAMKEIEDWIKDFTTQLTDKIKKAKEAEDAIPFKGYEFNKYVR
jgi:NH3-dependent NAD+ synthetase